MLWWVIFRGIVGIKVWVGKEYGIFEEFFKNVGLVGV